MVCCPAQLLRHHLKYHFPLETFYERLQSCLEFTKTSFSGRRCSKFQTFGNYLKGTSFTLKSKVVLQNHFWGKICSTDRSEPSFFTPCKTQLSPLLRSKNILRFWMGWRICFSETVEGPSKWLLCGVTPSAFYDFSFRLLTLDIDSCSLSLVGVSFSAITDVLILW